MPIFLNAFPMEIPDKNLDVCVIPYVDKEQLKVLRGEHQSTHAFRRKDQNILVFSTDGQ